MKNRNLVAKYAKRCGAGYHTSKGYTKRDRREAKRIIRAS